MTRQIDPRGAYMQGYHSAEVGLPLSLCPFDDERQKQAFRNGYKAAERDRDPRFDAEGW